MLRQMFACVERMVQGSEGDFDRELLAVHVLHNLTSLSRRLNDTEPEALDGMESFDWHSDFFDST